jgi:hypothetical protein
MWLCAALAALPIGCGGSDTAGAGVGSGGGADAGVGSDGSAGHGPHYNQDFGQGSASGCGTCPTGYTCGSANGLAVCRAPSGVPLFSNVFIIVMENTSWATLQGDAATNTPYLHGLISSAAFATDYHGVAHPSLPNYLALTSGSTGTQSDGKPVSCDCEPVGKTCSSCSVVSTALSSCGCEQSAQHLGDQLDGSGRSWKAYAESMGTPCNLTASGNFVPRHVPFLYYDNVQGDAARCSSRVVDFAAFASDLTAPPTLAFIAPNLIDDMHGNSSIPNPLGSSTNLANGDKWLAANVPAITSSSAFKNGGVLFIVWDEDDLSGGLNGSDDPIPLFVLSPYAKSGGQAVTGHADHYALLATVEDGLGLPRLGSAQGAQPLTGFFPAN